MFGIVDNIIIICLALPILARYELWHGRNEERNFFLMRCYKLIYGIIHFVVFSERIVSAPGKYTTGKFLQ